MEKKLIALTAVSLLALVAIIPICEAAITTEKFDSLKLQFEDDSPGDAVYIIWDFGDGTVLDGRWSHYDGKESSLTAAQKTKLTEFKKLLADHGGNIAKPVHQYKMAGTYTTSLTEINSYGYAGNASDFDGGLFASASETRASVIGSSDTRSINVTVEDRGLSQYIPLAVAAAGILMAIAGIYLGFTPVIPILGIAIAVIGALRYFGILNF